ncbi:hypothetical protein Taro_033765 [Colocasia esculenta]|uniref:Uncharacterized protein n=1 Tax=Colocasia esculenta TaxID=4460 RepID=A0A843VYT9_COLES|nr:hypothetical protein [Colocasia esculenta]
MPTVVTSSVGCPRFCVSQACARGLSRYLCCTAKGPQARVPKGARHGSAAEWSAVVVLVGLHSCLTCSRGAAARPSVRGCEAESFWGSFPTEPVTFEAHPYTLQVKERMRFLYRLPVQSRVSAVLGRRFQQCRFSSVVPRGMPQACCVLLCFHGHVHDIPCEAMACSREAESGQAR